MATAISVTPRLSRAGIDTSTMCRNISGCTTTSSTSYTVTTNASGVYSFTNVLGGNYSVQTDTETGYERVSQPGTITDLSGVAATTTRNLITRINNLVISGSVIDDLNNDGADTGETTTTASPTVTLYLDNPSTGTVGSRDAGDTTVGSPGSATFSWSGLSSGTYFLVETDPANYTSPRATISTFAPSRASARAQARPIPREAPVMMAVLRASPRSMTKFLCPE